MVAAGGRYGKNKLPARGKSKLIRKSQILPQPFQTKDHYHRLDETVVPDCNGGKGERLPF